MHAEMKDSRGEIFSREQICPFFAFDWTADEGQTAIEFVEGGKYGQAQTFKAVDAANTHVTVSVNARYQKGAWSNLISSKKQGLSVEHQLMASLPSFVGQATLSPYQLLLPPNTRYQVQTNFPTDQLRSTMLDPTAGSNPPAVIVSPQTGILATSDVHAHVSLKI